MANGPDSVSTEGKSVFAEKAKDILSRLLLNKEKHIEEDPFMQLWDDETCLALKTEIEARPQWVDADKTITIVYERLVTLLGPPDRKGITLDNIRDRIIFTDSDTITSFRYLFEQPGEDSDKYWRNPSGRMIETRGEIETEKILMIRAVSYGRLGIVMVPNEKDLLTYTDTPDREYIEKQGVNQMDYPKLTFKRLLAHELTHFLYPKGLRPHHLLNEPIVDYVASLVFPEIRGTNVKLAWAKASVEDYLKRLGYKSIRELTQPISTRGQSKEKPSSVAIEVCQKYFSKLEYQTMGYPEEILNELNTSKYAPIPE